MAHKEIENLDKLIKEAEDAIGRLDEAKRGGTGLPLGQRVRAHLNKHSHSVINVLLAGCVFVVASSRLSDRFEYEKAKRDWEEERRKLTVDRNRVVEQLQAFQLSTESLLGQMEAVAGAGGRGATEEMRRVVQGFRHSQEQLAQENLSPAVAALLQSAEQQQQQQQQQQQPSPRKDPPAMV